MTRYDETFAPVFGGEQNLSASQRALYVVAGLGLAAAAARPRPNPILSAAALLAGTYLALSGQQGRCPVKAALAGASGHAGRDLDHRSSA